MKFQKGDLIYGNEDSDYERSYGLGLILDSGTPGKYVIHWVMRCMPFTYDSAYIESQHKLVSDIFRGEFESPTR